jgi:hypothetical protein
MLANFIRVAILAAVCCGTSSPHEAERLTRKNRDTNEIQLREVLNESLNFEIYTKSPTFSGGFWGGEGPFGFPESMIVGSGGRVFLIDFSASIITAYKAAPLGPLSPRPWLRPHRRRRCPGRRSRSRRRRVCRQRTKARAIHF